MPEEAALAASGTVVFDNSGDSKLNRRLLRPVVELRSDGERVEIVRSGGPLPRWMRTCLIDRLA